MDANSAQESANRSPFKRSASCKNLDICSGGGSFREMVGANAKLIDASEAFNAPKCKAYE
jgi:hypothetical protein